MKLAKWRHVVEMKKMRRDHGVYMNISRIIPYGEVMWFLDLINDAMGVP
jgi:hypothetical protein